MHSIHSSSVRCLIDLALQFRYFFVYERLPTDDAVTAGWIIVTKQSSSLLSLVLAFRICSLRLSPFPFFSVDFSLLSHPVSSAMPLSIFFKKKNGCRVSFGQPPTDSLSFIDCRGDGGFPDFSLIFSLPEKAPLQLTEVIGENGNFAVGGKQGTATMIGPRTPAAARFLRRKQ